MNYEMNEKTVEEYCDFIKIQVRMKDVEITLITPQQGEHTYHDALLRVKRTASELYLEQKND